MSLLADRETGTGSLAYVMEIQSICDLDWSALDRDELVCVAWAYYFFSIQFRENLEITCRLYPDDLALRELDRGERDTDNLSPWPGVAAPREKMNHDEFMRRLLNLEPVPDDVADRLRGLGAGYLASVRRLTASTRAMSIASYEDGGLEAVFRAILRAPCWDGALLSAFRHFLTEHIKFDSDPEFSHGALCRHLAPDDRIAPLWSAFKGMLTEAAPGLGRG